MWYIPIIIIGGYLAYDQWLKNYLKSAGNELPGFSHVYDSMLSVLNSGMGNMGSTNNEVDVLARTIYGEARGEGQTGMQAVANVIMNRVNIGNSSPAFARRFGSGVIGVCKKPSQFSTWNANDPNRNLIMNVTTSDPTFALAVTIASQAVNGTLPDITGGSTYYHTRAVSPAWSRGIQPYMVVGNHEFYLPSQIA